ncbi:MAG: acyltransferase family protein [Dehalococcoidia bacterium]
MAEPNHVVELSRERRHDLDWLRVGAFALLILFHVGRAFVPWSWHINDDATSQALTYSMFFLHQWRLPLLFMISGAAVWFSLGRRGARGFARERLIRLGIPLIFGMLVIVPPQVYYERLFQGVEYSSILEFYPSIFQGAYPDGNLSWHHLWYVVYVLVYSLAALPLLWALGRPVGRRVIDVLARVLSFPGMILLALAPLVVSDVLLRPNWPDTHNLTADWANLTHSLILFIYGYLVCADERIWRAMDRMRWFAIGTGILLTTGYYAMRAGLVLEDVRLPPVVYWSLKNLNMLSWIAMLFAFTRRLCNRPSPFLSRATVAVYPFYILHQTIIVIAVFYIVRLDWGVGPKFALLTLITFGGCLLAYEGVIRRWQLTRVVFGMKPTALKSPSAPVVGATGPEALGRTLET